MTQNEDSFESDDQSNKSITETNHGKIKTTDLLLEEIYNSIEANDLDKSSSFKVYRSPPKQMRIITGQKYASLLNFSC